MNQGEQSPWFTTMDFAEHGRQQTLNWITGNTATPPSALWVQLHVGDPGDLGLNNVAGESTRVQGSWGTTDATGTAVNISDLDWLSVAADETITHVSIWDASTGGNCWFRGPLPNPIPITVGSDLQLAAADAVLQLR